jgi:hypothetical protein
MDIIVDNGKVTDIFEYENPEGFIDPPLPLSPIRLEGYNWFDDLRPKKKNDIFNK